MVALLFLVAGCSDRRDTLKNGDLIFQVCPRDSVTDAITDATGRSDRLSFSHVGIIDIEDGEFFVIEASGTKGVVRTPLTSFLKKSEHSEEGIPLVEVFRIEGFDCTSSVERAKLYIGKPYDTLYLPDNGAFYCSELVCESYLDPAGNELFPSALMTFKDSTGVISPLWQAYFDKMGQEVPEGVPGSNPNDLSENKLLKRLNVDIEKWGN